MWIASLLCLCSIAPQSPATTDGLRALIRSHELRPIYDGLRKEIVRIAKSRKPSHELSTTAALLADPVTTMDFADELTAHLRAAASKESIRKILARSAKLLDVAWQQTPLPGQEPRKAIEEAMVRIEKARVACEAAFAGIPKTEHLRLQRAAVELSKDFARHIYVHGKPQNRQVWKQMQTVEWAQLYRAAGLLTPFVHEGFSEWLKGELGDTRVTERPPKVEGRLRFAKKTAAGWVVVGGIGDNVYDGPLAFVLDLGGDDVYKGEATRSSVTQRVNVVIDVSGKDHYETDGDFAQGCGQFGVSLLVDQQGGDIYEGKRFAQGACLAGIGILVDHHGDDRYEADAYAQGAGCFGLGLLLDGDGDDVMSARLASQGFAWPLSTGFFIDLAGDDTRSASGKYPSVYGTKGRFNGMSQGASIGFRTLACGGFGVLVDGGGDDLSSVGEFGHGCGYYFGCGIVRDFGGKDRVRASRYGIATGAHFGVGAVIDDAGDDEWTNRGEAAALAGNWDLAVSCFLDRQGDDRYTAPGLSLGASTITSFASFVDLDGLDHYEAGALSFGRAGHAEDGRRGTQSLALFVDLGGAVDHYPALDVKPRLGNRVDQSTTVDEIGPDKKKRTIGRGVFVDK